MPLELAVISQQPRPTKAACLACKINLNFDVLAPSVILQPVVELLLQLFVPTPEQDRLEVVKAIRGFIQGELLVHDGSSLGQQCQ